MRPVSSASSTNNLSSTANANTNNERVSERENAVSNVQNNSTTNTNKMKDRDGVKGNMIDRRTTLTEDSIRSRGTHRRTNSRDIDGISYDIDLDDKIISASHALRSLAISTPPSGSKKVSNSNSNNNNNINRTSYGERIESVESAAGSAQTPPQDSGYGGASSDTSDTDGVVTSGKKKFNKNNVTEKKVKAILFSGGFISDRGTGKEYLGGETRIVSISRTIKFQELAQKISAEDAALNNVQILYPEGDLVISVKNDEDVETMFEEWETASGGVEKKLIIYVVEKVKETYRSNSNGFDKADRQENNTNTNTNTNNKNDENTTSPIEDASNVDKTRNGSPSIEAMASQSPRSHGGLQIIKREDLTLGARLGGGAFGEVYAAVWRGAEVAVKFINREFVFSPPGSPTRRGGRDQLDNIFEDEELISNNSDDDGEYNNKGGNKSNNNNNNNINAALMNNKQNESKLTDREEQKRKEKEEHHESFLREAETLATLSHPNVVSIFGVVTDGDRPGIVEEFLSGGSLQRVLAKERDRAKDRELAKQEAIEKANGDEAFLSELLSKLASSTANRARLDAKTRLHLCLDVARGMEYLHAKRFVHFDLKSDNILVAVRGRRLVCKVCDFGLSKQRRSQASFVSNVNSRRGTLPWTAPEVLRSPDKVSDSADVYSFAIVMWELWTSHLPHYGLDEYALYGGLMMHQLRPQILGDDVLSPRTGPYRAATKDAQPVVDLLPPCEGWDVLMKDCWKENSKERPKFVDIVHGLENMLKTHFN
jgi:serine/threonine protein kinase